MLKLNGNFLLNSGYNALRCNQAFYALRVNDYLLSAGAENLHSNGDRWNEYGEK